MGVKALFCSCIFVVTFGALVVSMSDKQYGTDRLANSLKTNGMVSDATKLPDSKIEQLKLVTLYGETSTEGLYCTLLIKHKSTDKPVQVVGTRLNGKNVLEEMNVASFTNVTYTDHEDLPDSTNIVQAVEHFITKILNNADVGPTFGIASGKGSQAVEVGVKASTVCIEKEAKGKANVSLGAYLRLDIVVKKA